MRIERADATMAKGWYLGPWNADLPISVGYAYTGIDEPHVHSRMAEIYIGARGRAEMRIETETVALEAGQLIVVEPGEAHTFLSSTADHFHLVIQVPGLQGQEAKDDKTIVSRSRLGL